MGTAPINGTVAGGPGRPEHLSSAARSGARLVAGSAALAVAIALVGTGTAPPDPLDGSPAADTVVTTSAVVLGGATLSFVSWVVARTRHRAPATTDADHRLVAAPPWLLRPLLISTLATLGLLLVFTFAVAPFWLDRDPEPFPPAGLAPTTAPGDTLPGGTGRVLSAGRPAWTVVAIGGLAALALALAVVAARSRQPPTGGDDELRIDEEITAALSDLDALDSDPDHRRVVIRAYARMERAMARTGTVRAASETAPEFLGRALTDAGAGAAPARRLADLFEQARFSTHPVDRAMRADASSALRVVRDELGQ